MGFLDGKTIKEIQIAQDKMAILFKCDDGDHVAKTDGDCCSTTWVESISLPAAGFPCKVLKAEEIPMPDLGSPSDYEVIAYYGYKIETNKGEIVIDYRNESNGYYGGSLIWPTEGRSIVNGITHRSTLTGLTTVDTEEIPTPPPDAQYSISGVNGVGSLVGALVV